MKKVSLVIICFLLFSTTCFAEMIDEGYINLIFDNFSKYSEEQKKENAELLEVLFSSNMGLDLLYKEVIRTKSEALKSYGISEEELKRNIEILKGWSKSDRMDFLNAGIAGDVETINMINNKYKKIDLTAYKSAFINNEKPIIEVYDGKFEDITKHWSKEYVTFLNERGIIAGKTENSFAPDDNIKKAEIITLVMNIIVGDADGLPDYNKDIKDIQSGQWYDNFMQDAITLELIKVNNNGLLQPENMSTREEVVDILIKSLDALDITISDNMRIYSGDFNDFENVDPMYKESMIIAVNLGFISGMDDSMIAPNELITRGQTAVVIKKLYEYILDEIR